MTIESRVDRLEDGIEELRRLNRAVVQMLGKQDERLAAMERHSRQTQQLWVAFAKHFGLPPEIWENDEN